MSSSHGTVTSKVVGNMLVASFLSDSGESKLWCADMSQLLMAVLEVKEKQGRSYLVMKRSGGAEEEIISFPDREVALEALQSVATAMLIGGGDAAHHLAKKSGWFKKFLHFVLMLLIAVVMLVVWARVHKHINRGDMVSVPPSVTAPAQEEAAPPVKTGVPVPADQLMGQ